MVTYWVCIVGWVWGWWLFGRPEDLGSRRPTSAARFPAWIVIPSRNESVSLPGLLRDLDRDGRTAARAGTRIVVVDDDSDDDTADIAASAAGVDLVEAPPLPEGWAGKCWACDRGVDAARRDDPTADAELVFLDADVRVAPGAIDQLLELRRDVGGLVSVQPWHDTVRPYEQLSALFNVIALMGTAAGSSQPAGAFGPVLATSMSDYSSTGGHASVRSEVVEDLAIAERYRAADLPVTVRTGGPLVTFRMYPTGVRDLVDGWTKNFALGAGATSAPRIIGIVCWIAAIGSSTVAVVEALQGHRSATIAFALYAAFVVQLVAMFRRVGRFGVLTAVAHPLLLVFFVGVFLRSLWRTHVRRSVAWRGRTITTATRRT